MVEQGRPDKTSGFARINRFAEYYRHRPEIEQPTIESRSERARKSDRKENGFEKRSRKAAPASTAYSSIWVKQTVSSPVILSAY